MDDANTVQQVIEWVKFLAGQGVLGVLVALFVVFVWKKGIPWGERYVASVEKLHDSIGAKMGEQVVASEGHTKALNTHDATMREAALVAFRFFQAFVQREFPNSAPDAKEAFDKLERIVGQD